MIHEVTGRLIATDRDDGIATGEKEVRYLWTPLFSRVHEPVEHSRSKDRIERRSDEQESSDPVLRPFSEVFFALK